MNILTKTLAILLVLALAASAQALTIIGGATGNGDFEATEPATGAQWYSVTPSWFNASGSEGINFTKDDQTGASSQPNSRAGMPYHERVQINGAGHTIAAAGEIFSLSYDFGAGGGPAKWTDEIMRTFLFTSTTGSIGTTVVGDMTEVVGSSDSYPIDRANDGQWTTRTVPTLYTAAPADVGKTVYLGMVFDRGAGDDLFPRIDVIQLDVTPIPEPSSLAMLGILGLGLCLRRQVGR